MKYDRQKIADMRIQGYTYEQIAKELNTTKGNISSQITLMRNNGWNITINRKWSDADVDQLILLRNEDRTLAEIAEILDKSYSAVKTKSSELVKKGIVVPKGARSSPTGSYSYQTQYAKSTDEELLDYVKTYVSRDACPRTFSSRVVSRFGSWTKALEIAGVIGNIGGKLCPEKETTLYLLDFGEFKKVGITQQRINQRFAGAPNFSVVDKLCTTLEEALMFEKAILSNVSSRQFIPSHPWFERNGKTECFIGEETDLADLVC